MVRITPSGQEDGSIERGGTEEEEMRQVEGGAPEDLEREGAVVSRLPSDTANLVADEERRGFRR